jgi:hypothetical protein
LRRNPEKSGRLAEGLFETRAQMINRKTVDTLFNMLENLAAYNNLSGTPGNILNFNENSIQINKKLCSVIGEKSL